MSIFTGGRIFFTPVSQRNKAKQVLTTTSKDLQTQKTKSEKGTQLQCNAKLWVPSLFFFPGLNQTWAHMDRGFWWGMLPSQIFMVTNFLLGRNPSGLHEKIPRGRFQSAMVASNFPVGKPFIESRKVSFNEDGWCGCSQFQKRLAGFVTVERHSHQNSWNRKWNFLGDTVCCFFFPATLINHIFFGVFLKGDHFFSKKLVFFLQGKLNISPSWEKENRPWRQWPFTKGICKESWRIIFHPCLQAPSVCFLRRKASASGNQQKRPQAPQSQA